VGRTVIISDSHAGHRSGLVPPGSFRYSEEDDNPTLRKFATLQRIMWDWYVAKLQELQPIDTLIHNSECIDGKAERQGGTELVTTDRKMQCEIAAQVIREAKAKRIYITRGTRYHSGREEDWDEVVGTLVNADHVGAHIFLDSEGVIFDVRHKVPGSVIPHGRFTGLARQKLWNYLWAEREMQPKAHIIVRSHVHYHVYCGTADWLALTTPSLQAFTKFGSEECEGTNDIGLTAIDTHAGGFQWKAHLLDMRWAAAEILPA
jgi:hypothetical protein